MTITLRPEAESDLEGAALWYEGQRQGLGGEFLDEVTRILEILNEKPRLYPQVHKNLHRAMLRRFPFGIFYHVDSEGIIIVAVMHASRNPKEWKDRI